jgi:hypothetical protein
LAGAESTINDSATNMAAKQMISFLLLAAAGGLSLSDALNRTLNLTMSKTGGAACPSGMRI